MTLTDDESEEIVEQVYPTLQIVPTIEQRRMNLYNKYMVLQMDRIKNMCIPKGIKLSVNRKQKRKDELVNELVCLEIVN